MPTDRTETLQAWCGSWDELPATRGRRRRLRRLVGNRLSQCTSNLQIPRRGLHSAPRGWPAGRRARPTRGRGATRAPHHISSPEGTNPMFGRNGASRKAAGRSAKIARSRRGRIEQPRRSRSRKAGRLVTLLAAAGAAANSPAGRRALSGAKDRATAARERRRTTTTGAESTGTPSTGTPSTGMPSTGMGSTGPASTDGGGDI